MQPTPAILPAPPCLEPPPAQERWFKEEVHVHESILKAHLRRSFPSVRDVDDVVQESYLRIWRRHLNAPVKSAKSFLYKIARHLAVDALRHERASPIDRVTDLADLSVVDGKPDAAEAACTSQEIEVLLEAIEALPARCREIVILRKIKGVSQKEIARLLGLSEETVQGQASKGLHRCQEFMRERGLIHGRSK